MIIAMVIFWYSSSDMLIHPDHPMLTSIIAKLLQAYQMALMFVMVFKNPGWMSRVKDGDYKSDPRNEHVQGYLSTCNECKIISKRASHCTRCGVCFEKIDHHCPWMNTCVADGNVSEFYSFICVTFGGLFYAFALMMMQLQAS